MIKLFTTAVLSFHLSFCFAPDSIPFYFDVAKFKVEKNIILVAPPYDTVKNLTQVPPEKIKTTIGLKNDTSLVQLISRYLFTAHEPIYNNNTTLTRSYRFTWLRSFDKQIIISLTQEKHSARIETRWLSSKGIERTALKLLPLTKLEEFEGLLTKSGFWQEKEEYIQKGVHLDGSNWIIEAKKDESYHFSYGYAPSSQMQIRKIGEWLIANSDASEERLY